MLYQGSCHCGRIAFEVEGELGKVMECNCSHCSRKGLLLWFLPREKLRITTPETHQSTYLFNKHVIRHQFCAECGSQPFAFATDRAGTPTAAINVRCLGGVEPSSLTRTPFDGRRL
jgi:hypothetical protein